MEAHTLFGMQTLFKFVDFCSLLIYIKRLLNMSCSDLYYSLPDCGLYWGTKPSKPHEMKYDIINCHYYNPVRFFVATLSAFVLCPPPYLFRLS